MPGREARLAGAWSDYEEGRTTQALDTCNAILDADPDNIEARSLRACLRADLSLHGPARSDLDLLEKGAPDDHALWGRLAYAYARVHDEWAFSLVTRSSRLGMPDADATALRLAVAALVTPRALSVAATEALQQRPDDAAARAALVRDIVATSNLDRQGHALAEAMRALGPAPWLRPAARATLLRRLRRSALTLAAFLVVMWLTAALTTNTGQTALVAVVGAVLGLARRRQRRRTRPAPRIRPGLRMVWTEPRIAGPAVLIGLDWIVGGTAAALAGPTTLVMAAAGGALILAALATVLERRIRPQLPPQPRITPPTRSTPAHLDALPVTSARS